MICLSASSGLGGQLATSQTSVANRLSLCTMLRDTNTYQGKLVVTEVSVMSYRHRTIITTSACPEMRLDLLVKSNQDQNKSVTRLYELLRQRHGAEHALVATLEGKLIRDESQRFVVDHEVAFELANVVSIKTQ